MWNEKSAAAIGDTLGPYQIVAEIGRGGMGVVYKAEDKRLNRNVAIKLLPTTMTANQQAKERLLAEARAVSALDHPNICTVFDIGEGAQGQMFLAMAYYDGHTLEEEIQSGPLPLERAVEVATQVARGLAHAHEMNVTHRDIKPSNIFLTARGDVKVLDFGLAKQGLLTLSEPGMVVGTAAYMPPEQALGKKVDHRADLWALGVVFYEMVTARKPFPGEYRDAMLYAIVNDEMAPLPEKVMYLPSEWQRIVERALKKNREERYQSSQEVIQDLLSLSTVDRHVSPADLPSRSDGSAASAEGHVDTSPFESSARSRNFVGRESEKAELLRAFESCQNGAGSIVCLSGEPGIGKTTLAEGFLSSLDTMPAVCYIARGRCSERLAGSEAYLPIFEALDSLLRGESRDYFTQLMKEQAPTWYVRVAPVSAASDTSFAQVLDDAKVASQERMKRELSAFLQAVSRQRAVVLFCEDLHWADVSTVDVLSYIGNRIDTMRVLVLGTYRPSDLLLAKHPFLQVKRELQSRGLCRETAIEFLNEQDIESYLGLEFPGHSFPPYLASLVRSRTEGNPLFMADLLRDLRDREVIAEQAGGWVLARPIPEVETDLPESIRGMIERKIDRLGDEDESLLAAASVQGQEFDSSTLGTALDRDVNDIEEHLENLARAHRFVRVLDERELPDATLTQRYSFVHALYQNALYSKLRSRQRASLSAAIADALVGSHGEKSTEIASDLGYLFETARRYDKAAEYFLRASDHATSVYAYQEAETLVRRAMTNADKLKGEARLVRVLGAANRLGKIHLTLSRLDEAVQDFDLADVTAGEMGDTDAQVEAICASAAARFNLRRIDETREAGRRAREIARAAGSGKGVASAELILGLVDMGLGEVAEAQQNFNRSLPVLRDQGAPLHAIEAIGFAGLLHAWQLDYTDSERAVNWTLQKARDLGTPYHIIMILFVRGMARFNEGRLGEGLSDLEEGMRIAELTNERYWLSRYPNTLAWAYRELQEPEKALKLNLENAEDARRNGFGKPEAQTRVNLAYVFLDLGDSGGALEQLERAEEILKQDAWFRWRYYIRVKAAMAAYWVKQGDTKQATACATESLNYAAPRMARKHMAWAHKLLGDIAVLEERFDDGQREYNAALRVLKNHHCPTIEWRVFLAAAEMASAYGDVPLAENYRGHCKRLIRSLADSLTDSRVRDHFLRSETIRPFAP
jgi:serine/threonine protein kinase/tetratricopeptide (TPR) repeat protein